MSHKTFSCPGLVIRFSPTGVTYKTVSNYRAGKITAEQQKAFLNFLKEAFPTYECNVTIQRHFGRYLLRGAGKKQTLFDTNDLWKWIDIRPLL
jgi:hypothetical protein